MPNKIKIESNTNKTVLENTVNQWLEEKKKDIEVQGVQYQFSGGLNPSYSVVIWYFESDEEEAKDAEEYMQKIFCENKAAVEDKG